jgi:GMP synthase (glutamine-hydrolysing)
VKELPDGFRATASNENCQIQAMQQKGRRLFGIQFHPELFDAEHPQGQQVVENFLHL